jgi:SAM-dependent methyltransferase
MDHDTPTRIFDHRTPEERGREFLPGMGRPWLLPFYDLFSRFSRVRPVHDRTAALADVGPGESVLDVGCGTGNLSLAVLRAQPAARVTGLDPDGAALRVAARKAARRGISLRLVQGFADRLPAEDGSLDRIVSTLALHHVPDDARDRFGHEAFRALRPGGTITLTDFGGPAHGGSGHGGPAHGGPAHGGSAHGGSAHGGSAHGGSAHGGSSGGDPAHSDPAQSGPAHGGPAHGGPAHGGSAHGGPVHEAGGGHGQAHWYGRLRGHGRPHRHAGGDHHAGGGQDVAAGPGGGLVRILADAGFADAREVARIDHRYGQIAIVQATRA